MTYGVSRYGEGVYGKISTSIEGSDIIPRDAKEALKDYLRNTFEELWTTFDDILNLNPPADLLSYWDVLIELVKALM